MMERNLKEGRALARQGAERAANHAGIEWKELAWSAFLSFLDEIGDRPFIIEDVRFENDHLPDPPDKRAWGQISLRAKRAGLIEHAGYAPAKDKAVHGNMVSQWRKVDNTEIKQKAMGLVLPHFPNAKITAVRDYPLQGSPKGLESPPSPHKTASKRLESFKRPKRPASS